MQDLRPFSLPLLALVAALAGGCATSSSVGEDGGAAPSEDARFTHLERETRWMTAAELPAGDRVVLALVDIDVAKPVASYRCAAAACRPDGGGTLTLSVMEEPVDCPTLLALRDALLARTEEPPFGLVLTAGGRALGTLGSQTTPAMEAFLRYFSSTLGDAGVRYAFIVPDALVVVADPSAR